MLATVALIGSSDIRRRPRRLVVICGGFRSWINLMASMQVLMATSFISRNLSPHRIWTVMKYFGEVLFALTLSFLNDQECRQSVKALSKPACYCVMCTRLDIAMENVGKYKAGPPEISLCWFSHRFSMLGNYSKAMANAPLCVLLQYV